MRIGEKKKRLQQLFYESQNGQSKEMGQCDNDQLVKRSNGYRKNDNKRAKFNQEDNEKGIQVEGQASS